MKAINSLVHGVNLARKKGFVSTFIKQSEHKGKTYSRSHIGIRAASAGETSAAEALEGKKERGRDILSVQMTISVDVRSEVPVVLRAAFSEGLALREHNAREFGDGLGISAVDGGRDDNFRFTSRGIWTSAVYRLDRSSEELPSGHILSGRRNRSRVETIRLVGSASIQNKSKKRVVRTAS